MHSSKGLCPRCRIPLFRSPSQRLVMFGCGRCAGLWLDRASVQAVFERIDPEAHQLATLVDRSASLPIDANSHAGACPSCLQPMTPRHVAMAGIVVDDCHQDGTWFDREELRKWIEALAHARGNKQLAVAAGVGAAAAVGVGAAYLYSQQQRPPQQQQDEEEEEQEDDGYDFDGDDLATGAELLVDTVTVAPELAEGAVEVAGAGLEVAGDVAEGAGEILGGVFELLGGLFD